VWVTPNNIVQKIEHYLINKEEIKERGLAGKAWVKLHHNPNKILKQYLYLYDLIRNGHCYMESPNEQLIG
jgi:hypothetical protein